ncbi:MAG: alpha/beta hydrolase [Pseudomonadota bacterium]
MFFAAPSAAQSLDPFLLAQLESSGTVEEIEAAIGAAERAQSPDLRLLFDLAALRIDRLEAELAPLAAARALTDLALFAQRHRAILEEDPLALLERARDLFATQDRPDLAAEVSGRILIELRDVAADEATIIAALREEARLLRLAGNSEAADARLNEATFLEERVSSPSRNTGDEGGYRLVDVFYATDRARSGKSAPSRFYGSDRGPLETGIAQVSIPNAHRPGDIEAPSIWRLEFGPSPAKHIVLRSVSPLESAPFFARLSEEIDVRARKELFVFIHGYNVTFAQAAKRAAQMAYDMNFAGIPVLYSWPSRGATTAYISDSAVVRRSGRHLRDFLTDLLAETGEARVHIIAHSMGNRAVSDALELMATATPPAPGAPPFDQVIFAAPDVDAELFQTMLKAFRPLATRMTLYASDQDWALSASRRLHGNAPRAGQAGAGMIRAEGLDAIDMSSLGEDMLAHSYFADDASALVDLSTLFWRGVAPDRRCGIEAEEEALWRFVGGVCSDTRVLAALTTLRTAQVETLSEARDVITGIIDDATLARDVLRLVEGIISE